MPDLDAIAKQMGMQVTPASQPQSQPARNTAVDDLARQMGMQVTLAAPPSADSAADLHSKRPIPTALQGAPSPGFSENLATFGRAAYETGVKPLTDLARDVVSAPFSADSRSRLAAIPGNIVESHKAQVQRANEANQRGEYDVGLTHAAAAAIPVVGPIIGSAYDKILRGNPAEGAGELAGGTVVPKAVTKVAGSAASKVAGRIKRPLTPPPPSEAAQAMEAQGIPVALKDYTDQGRAGRIITNLVQNRTLGREPFYQQQQAQNTAARAATERIGEKINPQQMTPPPAQIGAEVGNVLSGADEAASQSLTRQEAARIRELNIGRLKDWHTEQQAENAAAAETTANLQEQGRAALRSGPESEARQRAILTQQEQLRKAQDMRRAEVLDQLGSVVESTGMDVGHTEVGKAVVGSFDQSLNKFRSQAKELYRPLDSLDAIVDVKPIKAYMTSLAKDLAGITGATAAVKGAAVQNIMDMANRWGAVPDAVVFSEARDIISALKSMGRDVKKAIPSRDIGVIHRLTDRLESNMEAAANGAGPEYWDAYQRANDFYRKGAALFNESPAADLVKQNPERIASAIWKPNNATVIDAAQSAVSDPTVWGRVVRRGLDDLMERSMSDGELNGRKLLTEWNKLGREVQARMDPTGQIGQQISAYADAHGPAKLESSQAVGMLAKEMTPPPSESVKAPAKLEAEPRRVPLPSLEEPRPVKVELTPAQQALRTKAAKNPAAVTDVLLNKQYQRAAVELADALKGSPELMNSLRRAAWDKFTQQHTGNRVGGGEPLLNSQAMAKSWNKMSMTQRSIIAGEHMPEVNQLMRALEGLDLNKVKTLQYAIYGGVLDPMIGAGGLSSALTLAATGHVGGAALTMGSTALALIGPRYLGRALTNPGVIKWLTQGLDISPGTQEAIGWAKQGAKAGYYSALGASSGSREQKPRQEPRKGLTPPPGAQALTPPPPAPPQ